MFRRDDVRIRSQFLWAKEIESNIHARARAPVSPTMENVMCGPPNADIAIAMRSYSGTKCDGIVAGEDVHRHAAERQRSAFYFLSVFMPMK